MNKNVKIAVVLGALAAGSLAPLLLVPVAANGVADMVQQYVALDAQGALDANGNAPGRGLDAFQTQGAPLVPPGPEARQEARSDGRGDGRGDALAAAEQRCAMREVLGVPKGAECAEVEAAIQRDAQAKAKAIDDGWQQFKRETCVKLPQTCVGAGAAGDPAGADPAAREARWSARVGDTIEKVQAGTAWQDTPGGRERPAMAMKIQQ